MGIGSKWLIISAINTFISLTGILLRDFRVTSSKSRCNWSRLLYALWSLHSPEKRDKASIPWAIFGRPILHDGTPLALGSDEHCSTLTYNISSESVLNHRRVDISSLSSQSTATLKVSEETFSVLNSMQA